MKKFAVIGLGNFGATLVRALAEEGHEVIAIDKEKERVQAIGKYTVQAILADATQKRVLEELGLDKMDAVIVSLGRDLGASVLVTLYLKDLKCKRIIVKIANEDHRRILERVGATDIIFPERDTALRLAQALTTPNIMDYLPLTPEYSIIELAPPKNFIGKTLGELELRSRYGINVLAVRQLVPEKLIINPGANFVIKDSDILYVLGKQEDIEKLK